LIAANVAIKTVDLIRQLNRKIRGWANYYRHVVAKRTFAFVDQQVYLALSVWIKRRHPQKTASWQHRRFFRAEGLRN
jgi:RNA-directed DNA polymerase